MEMIRSQANSLLGANQPIGPWPIHSLELSFPGAKWPRNFRSKELSHSAVFAPRNICSLQLMFPVSPWHCLWHWVYSDDIDVYVIHVGLQRYCANKCMWQSTCPVFSPARLPCILTSASRQPSIFHRPTGIIMAETIIDNRAVTVPLIPFPVLFGSVFQQKPRFRFGSVFSYLLTIFGHFKSWKHKRC